jgi:hypothetical protein
LAPASRIFVGTDAGFIVMSKKQKAKPNLQAVTIQKERTVENLSTITDKRTGGAINITGITYQTLYATYMLLREFADKPNGGNIRLEGLEDIDLDKGKLTLDGRELIQLKTSINSLDAAGFWGMDVLKNFLEVYRQNQNFEYRFVYNMPIAAGHLQRLIEGKLNDASREHWHEKIKCLKLYHKELKIEDFLSKITFEKTTAESLYKKSIELLLIKHGVNPGTEKQYLKSIFFNALEWSKERAIVDQMLFNQTIQQVTDAFYKGPINAAVINGWITPVDFKNSNSQNLDYFEGKAARPEHILQQLPARRHGWEKHIQEQLEKSDVVIIKSSSGQGKSTLAWQTAYNLLGNYNLYQLHHAQQAEYIEPVVDFIKSRVQIGESPLIIVDGLDQQLQHWSSVVLRLAQLPVKFIVTTREEDWYTFSNDGSKINLQIVNISLSEDEAKIIYQQLKAKNKVHVDSKNWQTPWEKVKERGLLIEYTYLLTKGEMISERLGHQIKKLNTGERNSGAKIEVLRMIGIADILGLRLKSKSILAHVQKVSGITGDRGELLKELEQEYFIRLGEQYVEGLHPVRSAHLVTLLHEFVAMEETLTGLLAILEPSYYMQFAGGASDLVNETQRNEFLKTLASFVSVKPVNEMVALINGLMLREPQCYWKSNRSIFDDAYQNGGIELFIVDTLPFTKLNMLEMLQRSFGDEYRNPSFLQQRLEALPKYKFQESDVAHFIRCLRNELSKNAIVDRQGLSNLVKWFNKLDDNPELKLDITESDLQNAMKPGWLEPAYEIFYYFRKTLPDRYQQFTNTNRRDILSWLKMETNTLTADEKDGDLYLTYLYDAEGEKVNEQSVRRIEWFYNFLQDYHIYHSDLVYLPFPTDELYKVIKMDAHKGISPTNLYDPFEVRINQSWSNTMLKNYEAESVYEWQSGFIKLRRSALDFIKRCTQFFEFLVEKNEQRRASAVKPLINIGEETMRMIRTRKRFPDQAIRQEEPEFKQAYMLIDEWVMGLQNFINQFSAIVLKEENHHIALINMKKMVLKLENAQRNFSTIAGQGYRYFDLDELQKDEVSWYQRLRSTVEYFDKSRDAAVNSAKNIIKDWWEQDQVERLAILTEGLRIVGEPTSFIFRAPESIKEDEYGKKAVIGVEGLHEDPLELEEQMFPMIWSLVPLSSLDIMTYDVVFIKGTIAKGVIRIQKTYLEQLMELNDTGEFEPSEFGNPIPINLEIGTVETLPGIHIPNISKLNITQDFSKAVLTLWGFQQYRSNINKGNVIEANWLSDLTAKYYEELSGLLPQIKSASESDDLLINEMIDLVIKKGQDIDNHGYINVLTKKVDEVNQAIKQLINNEN